MLRFIAPSGMAATGLKPRRRKICCFTFNTFFNYLKLHRKVEIVLVGNLGGDNLF